MRNLVADLGAIVGPGQVLVEPEVVAGYTTDWTRRYAGRARCVVRPGSVDEVAAVVRACAGAGVPIVPQGGNTGLVGGSVPAGLGPAQQRAGELPVILSSGRLTGLGVVD